MKFLLALMIAFSPLSTDNEGAVTACQVTGKVSDAQNAETLVGAAVKIVELDKTVYCDLNGRFSIQDVPPGKYTIQITQPGYEKLTIKGLDLAKKSEFLPILLSEV